MKTHEEQTNAFAQELLDFAIALVAAFLAPPPTIDSRHDPRFVGVTLLCRSITNFRGALVLARDQQPVESRALVRMIFENMFFLGALCEHGADFVKRMRSDEAANLKTLGELSMKHLSDDAMDGEHAQIIRKQINAGWSEFQSPKKFSSVKEVAKETVLNRAYLSYAVLSMDGHPSITSLKRYLQWEMEGDARYLTVNVSPSFKECERVKTV